jgi:hypothetical protein
MPFSFSSRSFTISRKIIWRYQLGNLKSYVVKGQEIHRQKKRTKGQTMIYKILQRLSNTNPDKHEVNSCDWLMFNIKWKLVIYINDETQFTMFTNIKLCRYKCGIRMDLWEELYIQEYITYRSKTLDHQHSFLTNHCSLSTGANRVFTWHSLYTI